MHAAKVIAIKVGEELLEQKALLLPTAYEWVTSEVQSIPNTELNHHLNGYEAKSPVC